MEFNIETVTALGLALMVFLRAIAKLTPTDKDNKIVDFIDKLFNLFLPDRKSGGGTH